MRSKLASLSTIAALRRLFEGLGYLGTSTPIGDATVIARWKGFQVAAVESEAPVDRVRTLARSLTALPGRTLAVALRPGREMALAAPRLGGAGITAVLVIDLANPSSDAVHTLERCRPTAPTGLAHALHIDNVLSSEIAGDRFYSAFRMLHRQLLRRSGGAPEPEQHLAALLPLLRVLFLYFVQAKGWLDGRPAFLREELDAALQRRTHFHRHVLNRLCFQTLNRPVATRTRHLFGRIPYLNGGLFEPHAVERTPHAPAFENEWWRDAFDEVFERFRFCVRESDQVGAIAPDMLGRVFERLMASDERHASGTFYTPEIIVGQIVNATLEAALAGTGHLPNRVVRDLVAHHRAEPDQAEAARRALHALRILDPAVGSGAFLLGTLASLTHLHAALAPGSLSAAQRLDLRKQILRENLFGVDRNPVAVRLAELRLWLAVIADDPTQEIEEIEPLPNLDGVVRQGDSLLDPIAAARALGTNAAVIPARLTRVIAHARRSLFHARGDAYRPAMIALREAEAALSQTLLEGAQRGLAAKIRDLDEAAESRNLFGERVGLTPEQRRARRALVHQRDTLEREGSRVHRGAARFFSFASHLPDIMNAGGFSAVIGNPPWVRSERIAPALRKTLQYRFRWWRPDPRAGFRPLPDLCVAFLERALELVRKDGAVGFLLPAKLTTAGYAEPARMAMVRETSLRYLHRVPAKQANLFGATTYPVALVLQKTPPDPETTVALGFDRTDCVRQSHLDRPGPWIMVPDRSRSALAELAASACPLGRLGPVRLGVKTGANAVFLGRGQPLRGHRVRVTTDAGTVDLPDRFVRRAVRGRDVRPFSAGGDGVILWLFDTAQRPLTATALPAGAAAYFRANLNTLTQRADYRRGTYWVPFRIRGASGDHRVIWPDIARGPRALSLDHADCSDRVPLNTCYVFCASTAEEALVVAAVLNSTWAACLVHATADEARGGYRRINARVASTIPIPNDPSQTSHLAALSRDLHERQRVSTDDLDEAVADALRLSPRTRSALRALAADHG